MLFTRQHLVTLQSNLQALMVDRWTEFNLDPQLAYWDELAETKTMGDYSEEIYEWLVNVGRIRKSGEQGIRRYDNQIAWSYKIEPGDYEASHKLRTKDVEDNKLQAVSQWASDMGGYTAYFPQEALQKLLAAAESEVGYDEVPFFSANHPRIPGQSGSGTWSNLKVGAEWALGVDSFPAAIAAIKTITGANGINRFIKPYQLWFAPGNESKAKTILNAQFYGKDGSTDNILRQYGFDAPRIMQDHPDDGSWYLRCKILSSPFRSPMIYLVRKDWQLNSFADISNSELFRAKEFEWMYDARVEMCYGEPSALFKFKPS